MAISDVLDRLTPRQVDDSDDPSGGAPDDLSSLDDGGEASSSGDALTPDPKPARRKSKMSAAASAPGKVTIGQKKQVRDALLLLMTPAAGFWSMRDPHCGGTAFAQREAIVDAMVPIICRNANMLRWFTASNAPWLDYLALLTALQPVGVSVWQHHVKKTLDDAGGGPVDLSAYVAA